MGGKPVSLERLSEALHKWLSAERQTRTVNRSEQANGDSAIDVRVLEEILGEIDNALLTARVSWLFSARSVLL